MNWFNGIIGHYTEKYLQVFACHRRAISAVAVLRAAGSAISPATEILFEELDNLFDEFNRTQNENMEIIDGISERLANRTYMPSNEEAVVMVGTLDNCANKLVDIVKHMEDLIKNIYRSRRVRNE